MADGVRSRFRGEWIAGGLVFLFGALLIALNLQLLPGSEPTTAPTWVAFAAGALLTLVGVGLILPSRQALIAFSLMFVLAALFSAWLLFSPGPLGSTIEIFTPFGYFARRLGDTPTRIMAAIVSFFAIGFVAVGIPQALKDEFGEKRWLSAIQGIGLLMIAPLLLAMIVLLLTLASPVAAWRVVERRWRPRTGEEP